MRLSPVRTYTCTEYLLTTSQEERAYTLQKMRLEIFRGILAEYPNIRTLTIRFDPIREQRLYANQSEILLYCTVQVEEESA